VQSGSELGYALAEGNAVEPEFETQFVTAGSLLYSVDHRPWLPPDAHWLLSQSCDDLLFAHFAVDPATLRRLVPDVLTLDLFDGAAWVTVSPSSISHMRPSGIPALPGFSFFRQVNLRTYVSVGGKPGLFYFSVDTGSLSAVWFARVFFRMQYWHSGILMSGATIQAHKPQDPTIHFRSTRLHGPAAIRGAATFEATYAPEGEPASARRGSLDEFLIERYCVYSLHRRRLYRTEVHHQPWPLQSAKVEILANSLAEPFGLRLPAEPSICHFSRSLKMLVWAPQSIRR
jgi:hypothetical protein